MNRLTFPAAALALVLSVAIPTEARRPRPFAAGQDVAFSCSLNGAGQFAKGVTTAQVCALFQRRIDAAIAQKSRLVPGWPTRGNAIRVVVRFTSPREVAAMATVRSGTRVRQIPEITLDVMDKAAGLRDLGLLADQLARAITQ